MDASAWIIVFLVVYLGFICLLFYTLIFGDDPVHQDGIFGRVHHCMTVWSVKKFHCVVGAVFYRSSPDPAVPSAELFSRLGEFFERRVMPLIYVGLLAAGLLSAKKLIMPRLPDIAAVAGRELCPRTKLFCWFAPPASDGTPGSLLLSIPPQTHPDAVYTYGALALGSWLAVYLTDPGVVSEKTIRSLRDVYRYDHLLFSPGMVCKTCKLPKLARSKHDRLIGACVLRYDHYCGWTGNVVGLFNTHRFIFFLIAHLTMLIHGAMLCAEIVYARILVFIDGRYTYIPTNTIITRFRPTVAFAAEPTLCLFLFVLLVSIAVVGGFLIYHVLLVMRNVTTSESFKRTHINDTCEAYMAANSGRSYGHKLKVEARAKAAAKGVPGDATCTPSFGDDGMPINIYDNGIVANTMEVLFPQRFARRCTAATPDAVMRTKAN
jgi:DHHC palmitoyltransferase